MLDVIPDIYGPLTRHEQEAVDEYVSLTAGMLDTFEPDAVDGYTLDELRALASTLEQWWTALDALDADLAPSTDGDGPPTLSALLVRNEGLRGWFAARSSYLLAVARAVGVTVPQPDQEDGSVITSNAFRGRFGHHDPDVDFELAEHREQAVDQLDQRTAGTSRQGLLKATLAHVVDVFGEPGPASDPDKIHVQWVVDTPHGVATVYAYAGGHDCPPICGLDPRVYSQIDDFVIEWHVGGHDPAPGQWVAEQLGVEFRR